MDWSVLAVIREQIARTVEPHRRLFVTLVLVVAGLFLVQGVVPPSLGMLFFVIPVSSGAFFGIVSRSVRTGFIGGFFIGFAGYTPGTVLYGVATGGPVFERWMGPTGWLLALVVSLVVGLIAGLIMGAIVGAAGGSFAFLRLAVDS